MTAQNFGTDIDLEGNEIQNVVAQNIAGDSGITNKDGLWFFNTLLQRIRVRVGSVFETIPFLSSSAPASLGIGQAASLGSSTRAMREDATFGLPGYATSGAGGFMSASDKAKLDASSVTASINTIALRDGNGRTQFADPVSGYDAANYQWTMQQIALAKQGLSWKAPVRTIYTTNLSGTYNTGNKRLTASVNGVLPNNDSVTSWAAGHRLALNGQTTNTQNGLYVVIDPGTASTPWILERTSDFGGPGSVAGDIYVGSFFVVSEGTEYGDTSWVCSSNTVTIDTTSIAFQQDVKAAVDNSTIEVNAAGNMQVKDAGVTYAKFQSLSACSIFGRSANSTGVGAAISAGSDNIVLARVGGVLQFTTISNAMLAAMAAKSVKVNATNASAAPTDLAASAADQVLQVNSGNTGLEWGQVRTNGITNDAVTNAKLANMAGNTVKGAVSTGDPVDLTPAQLRAIIASDIASAANVLRMSGTLGDGVATSFVVNHALPAGLDVQAQVYYNSGTYATYLCAVERTATSVTFKFNKAPTAAQFRYNIQG